MLLTGSRAMAGPLDRRTGRGHIPRSRILPPANAMVFRQRGPRGGRMTIANPRPTVVIARRPGDLDQAGRRAGTGRTRTLMPALLMTVIPRQGDHRPSGRRPVRGPMRTAMRTMPVTDQPQAAGGA